MLELWLKFRDPGGEEREVAVETNKFVIGRHSVNDLSIADGRLSREHATIDRFGDIVVITDRGSSNGTEVNGSRVSDPTVIADGDRISLGGFEIEIRLIHDEPETDPAAEAAPEAPPPPLQASAPTVEEAALPKSFFVIAAVFGVLIIAGLGTILYLSSGKTSTGGNGNFALSNGEDDPPTNGKGRNLNTNNTATANSNSNGSTSGNPTPENANGSTTSTPAGGDPETKKTEANASAFLRKIADNDPRAFIIGEPATIVLAKIKSLSGTSALVSNINSARKNAAQIKALAVSKSIRPDLLAVAAIAKLNGSSGDVLQTAQTMVPTLDKLSTQNPTELGEECLVMIAAYDQGEAGDFQKMRNMLQDLATKMPDQARDIRTIWYLKKHTKITDAEFDFAVRFLAIGAITQNPKDFGVNADSLTF
jgi:pSer/pThr/pTyr-binding forkhead associated (FHA) protein